MSRACAVLFSGGTDSTCAAALAASTHDEIHLLTFSELATRRSPMPLERVERLRAGFPDRRFHHVALDNDRLLRRLCYQGYARSLVRHGLYNLATPGLSSLSWHLLANDYCRSKGIGALFDGLTRELMHFPGHMDFFVERVKSLHSRRGVSYENPVREWPTPRDRQFLERLLVDYHFGDYEPDVKEGAMTTGRYLFERGLMPAADVKGSRFDHLTQHDCYPFVLYNVFCFWVMGNLVAFETFERGLRRFFEGKFALGEGLLEAGALG